jgi:beta-glucosidase-like glycosyl hydrolase
MSVAEKAKLIIMNYGDVNSAPWSGSVIVNQTHLNAVGLPRLKQAVNAATAKNGITVLVGADQEGGLVNRMKKVPGYETTKFPSPAELSKMTASQQYAEGQKVGKALRAAGVNTLLGPDLDVADEGTLMNKQGRSFGSTVDVVVKSAQPFLDGLKAENPNVVVMAKHFPGYNVRGNSDLNHVNDMSTLAQVEARATPFFKVNGLDGIMMSSVRFPNIDNEPACFSKTIIGMLRKNSPEALVITDDIAAPGFLSDPNLPTKNREQYKTEVRENAKKAFLAGCDVVLTMDSSVAPQISQAITELIASNPELKPRLDAAARRMMEATLKATPGPTTTPRVVASAPASTGWKPA